MRRSQGASKTLPALMKRYVNSKRPKVASTASSFWKYPFLEVSLLTGFGKTHGKGLLPENSKSGWLGAYSRTPTLHFSLCMSRSEYTSGNYCSWVPSVTAVKIHHRTKFHLFILAHFSLSLIIKCPPIYSFCLALMSYLQADSTAKLTGPRDPSLGNTINI